MTYSMRARWLLAGLLRAAASHAAHPALACLTESESAAAFSRIDGCPSDEWLDAVADALPRARPVYVNVGANKGYSIAEWLGGWSQHGITARAWHAQIKKYAARRKGNFLRTYSCGNCNDCRRPPPRAHARTGGRVHALELGAGNRALLRHLIDTCAARRSCVICDDVRDGARSRPDEIGWRDERRAPVRRFELSDDVRVHDLAASNVSGTVSRQRIMTGDERAQALVSSECTREARADGGADGGGGGGGGSGGDSACETTRTTTIDEFLGALGLSSAYQVDIDTEGFDALVIEGMRAALARRTVAIVRFEVSDRGYWARRGRREGRRLADVLDGLARDGCATASATTITSRPSTGMEIAEACIALICAQVRLLLGGGPWAATALTRVLAQAVCGRRGQVGQRGVRARAGRRRGNARMGREWQRRER